MELTRKSTPRHRDVLRTSVLAGAPAPGKLVRALLSQATGPGQAAGRHLTAMLAATAALPMLAMAVGQATLPPPVPPLSHQTTSLLSQYELGIEPVHDNGVSVAGVQVPLPGTTGAQRPRLSRAEALDLTDIPSQHRRLLEADFGHLIFYGNRGSLVWAFVGSSRGPDPVVWIVVDESGMAFTPVADATNV